MNEDDRLLINRIKDLANISYNQNRFTFSNFLTIDEQMTIDAISSELKYVEYELWGGYEDCERQIIRFGSEQNLGYNEEFPIVALKIEPLIEKFSDDLNHRDFLGALMNLGISRNVLGDIVLKNNCAYVFCLEDISGFISSELTRVKHTSVKITRVSGKIDELARKLEEIEVLVSSPRLDAVVAALCKLPRSKALTLIKNRKVLLNNRICENNSCSVKSEATITIRGYGKFVYKGEGNRTKKDRVYLNMLRYI